MTWWLRPYHSQFFLLLGGNIDITIDEKFDMAWNCDKYTSWHIPYINVILNLDPYINIIWVQDELDLCTRNYNPEVTTDHLHQSKSDYG